MDVKILDFDWSPSHRVLVLKSSKVSQWTGTELAWIQSSFGTLSSVIYWSIRVQSDNSERWKHEDIFVARWACVMWQRMDNIGYPDQLLGWWFEASLARLSWMRAATGSVVPNPIWISLAILDRSPWKFKKREGCVENWELERGKFSCQGGSERSAETRRNRVALQQFSATFNLGADEKETNTYVHDTCILP